MRVVIVHLRFLYVVRIDAYAYRETAAPAFLYRQAPFLLLGFMFQFIAHYLRTHPERYSGGKFHYSPPLLSHVCPAAVCLYGYGNSLLFA